MGFFTLVAVTTIGFVVFLLVIGRFYPGNGSDLVDWDPAGRAAEKILAEAEDEEQMHALRAERQRVKAERAQRRQEDSQE